VEVVGKADELPELRFQGKADLISDWFGEKLHAAQVEAALIPLLEQSSIRTAFLPVACDTTAQPPGYRLYLEPAADQRIHDTTLAGIAAAMDRALSANVHSADCRRLGQLGPFACQRITGAQVITRGRRSSAGNGQATSNPPCSTAVESGM
jgi:hypothetical protein